MSLVVIEGTDSSGKETQTKLLEERLRNLGKKVIHFSFPFYDTPTGKIVGDCCLGRTSPSFFDEGEHVSPYISSLYFAADRKYNIDKIEKYLKQDYIVLLDRYSISNMAHQGGKISDERERLKFYHFVEELEFGLLKLPKPDLIIFLHMPTDKALILKKDRKITDVYEKDVNHLRNAEKTYLELAELYNFKKIECVRNDEIRTIVDINSEILNNVLEYEKTKN